MGVKNRKLCWNCEGSVHVRATKCPFCGSELSAETPAPSSPYNAQTAVPAPPYSAPAFEGAQPEPALAAETPKEDLSRSVVLPMLLLLPGVFFLLFGVLLALFATDGLLTLRWNARYWFVYCMLACPLLWFGWKSLSRDT